jgi:Sec7-like guanine-nucleotide exchange factor
LTRSHSETFSRRPPPSNTEAPALPKILSAFHSSQHHSTIADPTSTSHHSPRPILRRPMTADSVRSRTRSFFTLSPQTTSDPSTQTPHFGNALSSLTSSTSANHANNRPRSATNPPLLHRLSINFFASSTASAKSETVPGSSITASPVFRSRPTLLSSVPSEELKPQQDELPEAFLQRLSSIVGKADIAGLLGSRYIASLLTFLHSKLILSAEVKYVNTLKLYIGMFSFTGDPLDVALRRLLMHIGLPRETQQIDRVIEAFAKRYVECNPDIFMSDGRHDFTDGRQWTCAHRTFRYPIHSRLQSHHASHRCIQQIQ